PAPPRARARRARPAGARLGGPGVRRRGAARDARLAPLPRQHDRGRHLRGAAQHHREARPRAAGLMALVLTEEQELLRDTARGFVASRASRKRVRALHDGADSDGFSRDLWREMARLGWVGIILPEAHGGLGLGYTELALVMEELGKGLAPEPMLSTVLLGANAILLGGSEVQHAAHLPAVAAGERLLALAYQEPHGRYDIHHVETRAERAGGGWTLRGEKTQVLDGQVADLLVVSARTSRNVRDADGITLFIIPPDAAGVAIQPQTRLDGRNAAIVRLDGVRVDADAVVGAPDRGGPL